MNISRYIEKTYLSEDQLVENTVKVRTLNLISEQLRGLLVKTTDAKVIAKINALIYVLEDGYKIAMYKFQFKAFTLSLNKEIEYLKRVISRG